ncbi:MAG: peptidylprolyl isomerase [Candidatus Sericytochromatia bacterium]|nr:peptidylprolyl isomerase [Candidatus Sericytochromatia bacterium]
MHTRLLCLSTLALLTGLGLSDAPAWAMAAKSQSTPQQADRQPGAPLPLVEEEAGHVIHLGARLTFETSKGNFTFVTFPREAPKTVEQIVRLVRAGFYDGLAVHRIVRGTAVQMGDPGTRNKPAAHPEIGRGGSGKTIAPEFVGQTVRYLPGTVGLARGKSPTSGDSQFFVTLDSAPHLEESYAIFGQVTSGMDVVRELTIGDRIHKARVSQEDPGYQAPPAPSVSP